MTQGKSQPVGLEDERDFESSLIASPDAPPRHAPPTPPKELGPSAAAALDHKPGDQPGWVGKYLGHFKLLRLLGEGSMGRVIQAQDIHLKRIVALKILRRRITGMDRQSQVDQFLREARAAAKIEHPNVVQIYEINQHGGWWYIAMELVEGGNLRTIVKAAGPLSAVRACSIIADAASALAVAHELGIIHRDIKPSNLMLTRAGRCKITDFGMVRMHDPADPFDFTDLCMGTPQFMAPEVIQGGQHTPLLDVYSLGASLYYALTGLPPFVGQTTNDILRQHVSVPPPDVRVKVPECPESLARLIQQTMAKKPQDRPTAAAFASALHSEMIDIRPRQSAADTGSWPPQVESQSVPPDMTSAAGRRSERSLFNHVVTSTPPWVRPAVKVTGAIVLLVAVSLLIWGHLSRQRQVAQENKLTPALLRAFDERYPDASANYGVSRQGYVPLTTQPPATTPPNAD